jgi:predicted metal-binding protein
LGLLGLKNLRSLNLNGVCRKSLGFVTMTTLFRARARLQEAFDAQHQVVEIKVFSCGGMWGDDLWREVRMVEEEDEIQVVRACEPWMEYPKIPCVEFTRTS